jgi:hypothetical protein
MATKRTRGRPRLAADVGVVLIKAPQKLIDAITALAEREGKTASEVWRAAAAAWVARYGDES